MNRYSACHEAAPRAAKAETASRARNYKEQEVFYLALPKGNSNVHNIKKNVGKATLRPHKSRFIKCTKVVLPKGTPTSSMGKHFESIIFCSKRASS